MATEAKLQADLTAAMKARAKDEMNVLRTLISAIKNLKVKKRAADLDEVEIASVIRREVNKRKEAIDFAIRGARDDVIAENERQREILERYLPRQLGEDALEQIVRDLAKELETTAIGPLMAALRERHPGEFDGKQASEIIRKL